MPATWDQIDYLAMAICPILGAMNAGPGQPFRVDLYPSSLPLPLISGLANHDTGTHVARKQPGQTNAPSPRRGAASQNGSSRAR